MKRLNRCQKLLSAGKPAHADFAPAIDFAKSFLIPFLTIERDQFCAFFAKIKDFFGQSVFVPLPNIKVVGDVKGIVQRFGLPGVLNVFWDLIGK